MKKLITTIVLIALSAIVGGLSNASAQISDIAVSYGQCYCGIKEGYSRWGSFENIGVPIGSSEIRFEVSQLSMFQGTSIDTGLGGNTLPKGFTATNLQLTTLELDYMYRGTIPFREKIGRDVVFMSMGGGLNYNYLNKGVQVLQTSKKANLSPLAFQNDSSYYATINNQAAMGFGLFMGVGFYILPHISIYGEYTVKVVFYNTDQTQTTGNEAFAWGGWRLGLRWQPFKEAVSPRSQSEELYQKIK